MRTAKPHLLVVILMVLSACGSTLQPGSQQVSAGGDGLPGETVSTIEVQSDTDQSEAASSSTGPTTTASSGGDGAQAPNQPTPESETPGATPATTQPQSGPQDNANTDPIRVGLVGADISALAAVFGVSGEELPDPFFAVDPFIEYINKTGGIAGRPIEPEKVVVDIQSDYNAEGQRVCETFTQDRPVDIVVTLSFSNEVMLSCLAQHGKSVFDTNIWTNDRARVDHPNWFPPDAISVDRSARAAIENAVETGVLESGDKLGVLYEDCPYGGRVFRDVVQPIAEAHGIATEVATHKCVENLVSDLGPVTNQARSAVLRFQSSGVSHVFVLSYVEAFALSQFTRGASDQRYYPKYIVTSNANLGPNSHPDGAVAFAADAKPNMSGIGYVPWNELGHRDPPPVNDAQATVQAECRQADPKRAGYDETEAQGEDGGWAMMMHLNICDTMFTLRDTLEANGGSFALADVASGYTAVLARNPSAFLAGGGFGISGDRRDGVGHIRQIVFEPSDKRFTYSGPPRPVS